mmetsp:Transcript_24028/g.66586  ORF Transcript_24028/g.66586 Transcript_24028/m.66586 type:complete len:131 (+) Transcript_24028:323-715(+)|eukprot:CAMPEP_0172373286 /NCGR_PEP_ID=MMETSP1060-20121228/50978_1 /TAXON_ID=37318 /ORGANISM="Pseudo-nitzschia pungens, Strain cf. cingulata" /LENGTH=130 /DNA_ID=CAMNT_0013099573 /DNA_START=554 /DNA_END=946 /DNA_ORIENTATION=-
MATQNFQYPYTPTSVRSAASIDERFDRMNIYSTIPLTTGGDHIHDTGIKSPTSTSVLEESSVASWSSDDNNHRSIENGIAFAKSQAALNQTYRNQRLAYKKLPLSVRKMTGINLKNIQSQPLAVRKGELC